MVESPVKVTLQASPEFKGIKTRANEIAERLSRFEARPELKGIKKE